MLGGRCDRAAMAVALLAMLTACGTSSGATATRSEGSSHPPTGGTAHAAQAKPPQLHTSSPTPAAQPPYIAKVVWVSLPSGRSLQIHPTESGRVVAADGAEDEAWHEILRKAPDAGTRGMRAQFDCHWAFARLAQPDKRSWNLEPWRPVVSAQQMYDARCNPGGPEV